MKTVRENYIYSLLNTLTGLLFPIITFPYISRVLLPAGVGEIQFFQSIIDYVILLTSLGLPLYAVREIAKVRDDRHELSKVAIEILLIHSGLTILGYLIVFMLISYVGKISLNAPLMLILSSSILLNSIGINWFFQGVEDFKYITLRTIFIRLLCLILLFVFVKSKDDLLLYALVTVISQFGGSIVNVLRFRKFNLKLNIGSYNFKRHIEPTLKIFVLNLIISIYVNLDTIMLGFMKEDIVVGYYSAATKLTRVVLSVVTSLGTVLLPRLSNLHGANKKKEFAELINKSFSFTLMISLPLLVGLIGVGSSIIEIFSGPAFAPSVLCLQIMSPVVLMIGISNILGIQILFPQGKENVVIVSTLLGAVINLFLNFLLIPNYAQNGAAIASLVAETVVALSMMLLGLNYIPIKYLSRGNINYIFASILMMISLYYFNSFEFSAWKKIVGSIFIGSTVYGLTLFIRKDMFLINILLQLKRYIYEKI